MDNRETIVYEDLYNSIQVDGKSLEKIAEENNTTTEILKNINPAFSDADTGKALYYTSLYVPRYFGTLRSENGQEHHIQANTLKPVIDKIKPKLYEILYRIGEFDKQTRKLTTERNHGRDENLIYTHFNVLWGINDRIFDNRENDAYTGYRKEIFDNYEKSINSLGMFFRHMTYLHHLFHLNHYFEIRQPGKLRKALLFTNQFLNVILARLDRLLFYLFHEYQMLNGSAQDWVIYQTLCGIIDGTFGEINQYFSKTGEVSWYTHYGTNFFSYGVFKIIRWARFERGVDGVKINDECIFDYSVDYEGKTNDSELNKIRDGIQRNLVGATDEGSDLFEERFNKAQTLATGSFLPKLEERTRESGLGVNEFLRQNPRAEEIFEGKAARSYYNHGKRIDVPGITGMGDYLDALRSEADNSIGEARRLFSAKNNWDNEVAGKVERATLHFYCYHLGLVLFFLAGKTRQEIGIIESLFVPEEIFIEEIRNRLAELVSIAQTGDTARAQSDLSRFQEEIKPFYAKAEELIKEGNVWGTRVEIAFLIVLCVAVSFVATPVIAGALEAVFGVGSAAVGIGTFASEVLIFTLAPELLRSLDRGTAFFNGSVRQFGVSLASNALMFGCFRAVGSLVRGLVAVGSVTHPVAQFFLNSGINFITGTLVTSPVFAFELLQAGQNPLEAGNEWGKFLLTHAVLSSTLALSGTVAQGFQARLRSETFRRITDVQARQLEAKWREMAPEIQSAQDELLQTLNDMKNSYRSDFRISRDNYDHMKEQYSKAVENPRKLLNFFRELRRDLVFLEATMSREAGAYDPAPNGELVLLEQSVVQIDAWMASVEYVPRMKYTLAIRAHGAIPDNNTDGILRLSSDDGLYMGKVRVIFEQADAIRTQTLEGSSLRILPSPAASEFPHTRSIAIEALFSRGAIRDLTRITVIDVEGRTDMDSFPYDRPYELPERINELETIPNQPALAVLAVERYNNFHGLSQEGMTREFNEGTPLSEAERRMYTELIKAGRITPSKLIRIQPFYDLAPKPIIYVADPFFFQGVNNERMAKVLIGYPREYIKIEPTDRVLVFRNTRGAVVESNLENTRLAFEEYVRWAVEGPPVPIPAGPPLDGFRRFRRSYRDYFQKEENGEWVDKYSRSKMNDVWDQFSKLEPNENKIKDLKAELRVKGIEIEDSPLLALMTLLNDHLSVNPLWTGKGYTATYSGRYGVREYLLKGPIKIDELIECDIIPIDSAFPEKGE